MLASPTQMACPNCDVLYEMPPLTRGSRAKCARCSTVLATSRGRSISSVLALAITETILMCIACFFPFLSLRAGAATHQTSIFDAVLAFANTAHFPVALCVLALIIILPTLRMLLLIYILFPLMLGRAPASNARVLFRYTEQLRPWCMVEVFVVGVAVSLVKVAGLADVSLGLAFWAITILVPITVWKDSMIPRWSLWSALEAR